jgi:hypothetical protein
MTVVTVPSALLGDRALRSLQRSDTFAHSGTPDSARPQIFAHYLEETCRLLAADRGLSDAIGMGLPRAAATEAAKTRLVEFVAQLVRRAQRSGPLRADLTLEDRRSSIGPTAESCWRPAPGGDTWACCWTASDPIVRPPRFRPEWAHEEGPRRAVNQPDGSRHSQAAIEGVRVLVAPAEEASARRLLAAADDTLE